ncbi:hypothetical protein XENTR_v10021208 [Xenopus tropicalis]|nr:hypothetical protein XENTR_v10021208 [Xenopus tropicalis]
MTPLLLRTVGIRAFSMASDSYASGSLSAAYVTCPNDTVAKDIARGLVERKLAACVNIIPQITSILGYRYAYHLHSVVHLVGCCEAVSLYHGKDSTIIHHCCFPLTSRSFLRCWVHQCLLSFFLRMYRIVDFATPNIVEISRMGFFCFHSLKENDGFFHLHGELL